MRGIGLLLVVAVLAPACADSPTAPAKTNDGSPVANVGGPPVIVSFAADNQAVPVGERTTLRWDVTDGATVTIDHGIGVVSGTSVGVDPSAGIVSPIMGPDPSPTYTLTATNAQGSSTAKASVTIVPDIEYQFFDVAHPQYGRAEAYCEVDSRGERDCHDMTGWNTWLPRTFQIWAVTSGHPIEGWVWAEADADCLAVRVNVRGSLYKQADTCHAATPGQVTVKGAF